MGFDYPFAKLRTGRTAAGCLPSAILLQPFPQWLDVGRGGTYPQGDMPEFRIDDLNSEQLRAATAGEGPVLTIAGAGTGKTKTLASRVAWLVSLHVLRPRDRQVLQAWSLPGFGASGC